MCRRLSFSRSWLILLLVPGFMFLLPAPMPGQEGKGAGATDEKKDSLVLRLRYASAPDVARVLKAVFDAKDDKGGRLTLVADDRTNSLIVNASPAVMATIRRVLEQLDAPVAESGKVAPEMAVLSLRNLDPDEGVEAALRLVLPDATVGRFSIDRKRRVVTIVTSRPTLEKVEALLAKLEMLTDGQHKSSQVRRQLRVPLRLLWLASGAAVPKEAPAPPDDLKAVLPELTRLGLDQPRVIADTLLSVTLDEPFELSSRSRLATPCLLTVAGTLTVPHDQILLKLTARATSEESKRTGTLFSLKTQLSFAIGAPVVIGTTAGDKLVSAFVVQVLPAPAVPKKAAGVRFDPRGKNWAAILEWLSDQTGLPVLGEKVPAGVPLPAGQEPRNYSLEELLDVLNDLLLSRRYLLVRGEKAIRLLPADELIDVALIPRIGLEELDRRGRTELVSVALPLKKVLDAEAIAREVKKLLSGFGVVVPVKSANQLVVWDMAGNLRHIVALVKEAEKG
jgi:hypothetical protein